MCLSIILKNLLPTTVEKYRNAILRNLDSDMFDRETREKIRCKFGGWTEY